MFIFLLLLISIVNAALNRTVPPIIFQLIYILFLFLIFRYSTKIPIHYCIKSIIKYVVFICVFESIITIILIQFNIDLRDNIFDLKQLLYCLPIKIIDIVIVYIFVKRKEGVVL